MNTPQRIQRQRTKGYNLQAASPNDLPVVYVGRPSKWGNPYRVGDRDRRSGLKLETPGMVVVAYQKWLREETQDDLSEQVHELRGKNLSCWCPLDQPCHADVLLRIANE